MPFISTPEGLPSSRYIRDPYTHRDWDCRMPILPLARRGVDHVPAMLHIHGLLCNSVFLARR